MEYLEVSSVVHEMAGFGVADRTAVQLTAGGCDSYSGGPHVLLNVRAKGLDLEIPLTVTETAKLIALLESRKANVEER